MGVRLLLQLELALFLVTVKPKYHIRHIQSLTFNQRRRLKIFLDISIVRRTIRLADQVDIKALDDQDALQKALEEEEWLDVDAWEPPKEVERVLPKEVERVLPKEVERVLPKEVERVLPKEVERVLPNGLTESQLTDTNAPGESIDSFEWELYTQYKREKRGPV
jgi:hypothetical protein